LFNHGVEQYRSVGTEASPGTRLIALSGHVNNPGIFEIPQGTTTFRDLFESEIYGNGIRTGHELKMFIPGGASAPWFFPEQIDLPLEGRLIGGQGSMLGSGAVVVMDETTDAVRAALRLVRFFARESCGKCTPCREGTTWEEKILQRILDGHGRPSDIDLLLDVADNISPGPYPVAADPSNDLEAIPFPPRQTTICPLGPSSVAPITSAIRRFRHEFEAKIVQRDLISVSSEPFTELPQQSSLSHGEADHV
jgi:NADH-quinone oxidoreductase subunit F